MDAIRIQADVILVGPTIIHRPGQIVVQNGKIVACSADCSEKPDLNLQGSILSAGLVNAHTHLEFSDLSQPFAAGSNFPEWIASVIRHRRKIAESTTDEECLRLRRLALQAGVEESRSAGVAIIADIVTRPWSPPAVIASSNPSTNKLLQHLVQSPSLFAFPEIIGLDEPRFVEAANWATELAATESPAAPIYRFGVSPHAPYSIHFPTAVKVLASSVARQHVTAMHVAESLDERQWLESGSGPFRAVFERLGVPADAPRASIMEIILWLSRNQRALLIHGNYLNEAETDLISASGMSIVYCPRTHRHFEHTEYPLRRFINSRINVVLGTDSRASNPDLDLWSEVLALRQSHPWVRPEWAYAAVTQRSAEALGIASKFGTLHVGRVASINVSRLDASVAEDDLLDELTTRLQPFTPLIDVVARQ